MAKSLFENCVQQVGILILFGVIDASVSVNPSHFDHSYVKVSATYTQKSKIEWSHKNSQRLLTNSSEHREELHMRIIKLLTVQLTKKSE